MARHHRLANILPSKLVQSNLQSTSHVAATLLVAVGALLCVGPGVADTLPEPPEPPRLLDDLRVTPRPDGSHPTPTRRLEQARLPGVGESPFYFRAATDQHGWELWRILPGGAPERLTDVCPGPCDSSRPGDSQEVATMTDGRVVFRADDGVTGEHLWITDGTEAGTQRLTPVSPFRGAGPSTYGSVEAVGRVPLDGDVYFSFRDQLWRTDGTPDGTERFGDSTMPDHPRGLIRVGDRLVFWSQGILDGEVYTIDGQSPVATVIAEGCPDGCFINTRLHKVVALLGVDDDGIAETLVFNNQPTDQDQVLLATGGTPESTRELATVCTKEYGCLYPGYFLNVIGDHVAFPVEHDQVWITDGTVAGTRFVARIPRTTWVQSFGEGPTSILATSYFSGTDSMWRLPLSPSDPSGATRINRQVYELDGAPVGPGGPYLYANSSPEGSELWTTDGTDAGTRQLVDLTPGPESSAPNDFVAWNGGVLFSANAEGIGRELFFSDGTADGTYRVADLRGMPDGSVPANFAKAGGHVFFTAEVTDAEPRTDSSPQSYRGSDDLYVTDGVATTRLLDGRHAKDLTPVGDRLFFVARDLPPPTYGNRIDHEPWITDGTPEGTHALANIEPGNRTSYPRDAVSLPTPDGEPDDQHILFFADEGRGAKIWASDGTPGTAWLVADIDPTWNNVHADEACPGICSPPVFETEIFPREARRVGDQVLFIGRNPEVGEELWITDGTPEGTRNLLDLMPGSGSSDPMGLVPIGDSLFFVADFSSDDEYGRGLWVTDTQGHATLLTEVSGEFEALAPLVNSSGSAPSRVVLLTYNESGQQDDSLWVSDGTPEGTALVATYPFGAKQLTPADGLVYFTVETEDGGTELARTDGTPEGTFVVRDLYPGERGSAPTLFATRGSAVVFGATDGSDPTGGTELWISGGAPGDVRNLSHRNLSDQIVALRAPTDAVFLSDGALLVAADDGESGIEPWILDDTSPQTLCVADAETLCLADRFRLRVDWRIGATGETGTGRVIDELGTADTGFFWFFGPDNVELAIKVLDGTSINDHHWLFYGALSDVAYTITAEDLLTGVVREYTNPSGNLCGDADVEAFREPDFLHGASLAYPQGLDDEGNGEGADHGVSRGALRLPAAPVGVAAEGPRVSVGMREIDQSDDKAGACGGDPATLCLQSRFEVRAVWKTDDAAGNGTAVPFSDETGTFWFFGPDNTELLVKILDGRSINGKFWVFYGALSDVEYTIRVVDSETGIERTYDNEQGNLCGKADVEAF